MITTLAQIEITVEGKTGRFLVDHDTPISVAKEMVFQVQKYLAQIEDAAKAQAEAQAKEAEKAKESAQESPKPEGE